MPEKTRVKRTKEERIAAVDQKIKTYQGRIQSLEKQRKEILTPPPKRLNVEALNGIYKAARAYGKTVDVILL